MGSPSGARRTGSRYMTARWRTGPSRDPDRMMGSVTAPSRATVGAMGRPETGLRGARPTAKRRMTERQQTDPSRAPGRGQTRRVPIITTVVTGMETAIAAVTRAGILIMGMTETIMTGTIMVGTIMTVISMTTMMTMISSSSPRSSSAPLRAATVSSSEEDSGSAAGRSFGTGVGRGCSRGTQAPVAVTGRPGRPGRNRTWILRCGSPIGLLRRRLRPTWHRCMRSCSPIHRCSGPTSASVTE